MAKSKSGKQTTPSMAELADPHQLYQDTVQCVESEIDFVDATFKQLKGREALLIREDFCGTANASCEWVRRGAAKTAIGVDIDPEVQAWGRIHNLSTLSSDEQARISLVTDDVRTARAPPVDAVLAMNFSYWYFKTREEMRNYFRCVRDALKDDGVLFMDAYGGYEAYEEMDEEREEDGYTYIWDQSRYNPITGETLCHIHFEFPDGSRLDEAFTYDWRLWSLPEIREILLEAGFGNATVYWDMAEDEDENDYQQSEEGEADAGWLAYIVAEK